MIRKYEQPMKKTDVTKKTTWIEEMMGEKMEE
jgi:hypothetical protein